jgi:adenylate cyclase class 2
VTAKISTKREIEIKLRVSSLREVLARIRQIGATPCGRVLEQNTLFDTPDSSFWRHGRLLRLRMQTPAPGNGSRGGPRTTILTAKSPPSSRRLISRKELPYKERIESELAVGNPRMWPQVIQELGFCAGFKYEKYRTSFRHRSLHLDLDETPIGTFLELEGIPTAINRTARALGFDPKDYIRATYWTLYAADCRRRHRKPRNMLFASQKSR